MASTDRKNFLTAVTIAAAGTYLYALDLVGAAVSMELRNGDVDPLLWWIATNNAGTLPTLDGKLQHSPDNANWYDTGAAFTQLTTGSTTQGALAVLSAACPSLFRWVRLSLTLGGTTPSYTITSALFTSWATEARPSA